VQTLNVSFDAGTLDSTDAKTLPTLLTPQNTIT
jgi:hypothetical protein